MDNILQYLNEMILILLPVWVVMSIGLMLIVTVMFSVFMFGYDVGKTSHNPGHGKWGMRRKRSNTSNAQYVDTSVHSCSECTSTDYTYPEQQFQSKK